MASSFLSWRVIVSVHSPFWRVFEKNGFHTVVCFVVRDVDVKYYIMSIYEILPALDLTQSVHAKIFIIFKLDFDHVTAVSSLMDRLLDLSKNSL